MKEIFKDDRDKKTFLEILAYSSKIYTNIFSYILMENHFHLLIETPLGNLGEFMRHFNITYTGCYNRRHNRVGHLYQGRYKSILVDKESYLSAISRYIHLNPVRIKTMEQKTDEIMRKARTNPPQYNPKFAENFEKMYEMWKTGNELPEDVTPIKGWPVITPAEQANIISANSGPLKTLRL